MTPEEILAAYRARELSIDDVQNELHKYREATLIHPLSEGQKGLWALQKMYPEMSAYNVPLCFRILNDLDIEMFKKACQFLLKQYPIFTSIIKENNGLPYQIMAPQMYLTFKEENLFGWETNKIVSYLNKKSKEPFLLEKGPLFVVHLISISEQEAIILFNIHHIIIDGVSVELLIKTLLETYEILSQGGTPLVVPSEVSFKDFVVDEQNMLNSKEGKRRLAYWKQQLSGELTRLNILTDLPRHSSRNFKGRTYTFAISSEISEQVKHFSKEHSIYLSTIFLGIFKGLLFQYTGQNDIILGMPVSERNRESFNQLIGFFINMIPVRSACNDGESFLSFLTTLQSTLFDGLANSYPFSALVRQLNFPVEEAGPLFQIAFEYQNYLLSADLKNIQNHTTLPIEFITTIAQEGEYEIVLEVIEGENDFILNLKYNPHLFHISTIERMMEHYTKLLNDVVADPYLCLGETSLISKDEEKTLRVDWNNTNLEYPKDKCFHQLFEKQAQKTPNSVAVVFEENSLTYKVLNEKTDILAKYLQVVGVEPDRLVAICVDRSLEMIIGLLGILKSGGAYVPLDPEYPDDRLAYMIEDSQPMLILTNSRLKGKVAKLIEKINSDHIPNIITLDSQWDEIKETAKKQEKLEQSVKPHHLAYVIYTSGSTGKPKGVMVPHVGLTNFLFSMSIQPGLQADDTLLAITTYCFDIAGLELYLPLIKGAKCYICNTENIKDAKKLKQEIERLKPTIMQATPSTWTMLFHSGWKNEENIKILCGGESFPETLKQQFVDTHSQVWNMYGPTETTIWSSIQYITKENPISIGKPIANTEILIINNHQKISPIGVVGEICIGGDGLARGYLNRENLTSEKFINHPFNPGAKLYKTGDLGRWLTSGEIEHLGRMDSQVKIRGFRIELGEIESLLNSYMFIHESVVVAKEYHDSKQLIAYYVPENPNSEREEKEINKIKAYLKSNLPEYMVPQFFIPLDKIPLTPNGKINRKELTDREVVVERSETITIPQSKVEDTVLAIWKSVLKREDISTTDGFFDVGGDSILSVVLVERISKQLNCPFSATILFKYSNIQAISQYISCWDNKNDKLKSDSLNIKGESNPKKHSTSVYPEYYEDSLAIIGISCNFPDANNHHEFWQNLKEGKESSNFLSKDELRKRNVSEELIQNPDYIPVEYKIEGKDLFDPGFFNISPKNAAYMDPQFRLLLLHSWKAIEDAGYVSKEISETSVFMSISNTFYQAPLYNTQNNHNDSEAYVAWLLAQDGTVATMISYQLGLKGPSFSVHANCSSSLVGLYSAYQSLLLNESKYALIGASALLPSTNFGYLYQEDMNFSSDGHCKPFDISANGMVEGEGTGVVLLKKASDAIKDGDHIYALLRGININNDGGDKAGFYAPSVKGQTEVIEKVLTSTKINPNSISYVEAHGTGTKLGDPIEVMAISDAYEKYTENKQFCGIGSVKSNIGHLDTAAGMAGCIKLALSLYHNEIPPSINYKNPNPEIDFKTSPFYVVDQLKKWKTEDTPRRGALSSLGIGGTNVHAIFEEYVENSGRKNLNSNKDSFLIVLSAKNEERLKESVNNLHQFITDQTQTDSPTTVSVNNGAFTLSNFAYTLQVGREGMENRLAFLISNIDQLKKKLKKFIKGDEGVTNCFRGEVNQNRKSVQILENDEDFNDLVIEWLSKSNLTKLAEVWVKGFPIDWRLLYSDFRPSRISLPTYPFAKESYWLSKTTDDKLATENQVTSNLSAFIHPLLHRNTSNLSQQSFSSTFTGHEFFFSHHVIENRKILPGVAYLEMTLAAVKTSLGAEDLENLNQGQIRLILKNVVWLRPIAHTETHKEIHFELFPEETGAIGYEVYTKLDKEDDLSNPNITHHQGQVLLVPQAAEETKEPFSIDIPTKLREINDTYIKSEKIYEGQTPSTFLHGPGFRGVEEIYLNDGQALGKISLPLAVSETAKQYTLHPSLMDSAVQVALYFGIANSEPNDREANGKYAVPFALQSLEIYTPCTTSMWAWARYSNGEGPNNRVQNLDVDICDNSGNICVKMRGLTYRFLGEASPSKQQSKTGTLMLQPCWKESAVVEPQKISYEHHRIIFCDFQNLSSENMKGLMKEVVIVQLRSNDTLDKSMLCQLPIGNRIQKYGVQIFEIIQKLIKDKPTGNILIQVVIPGQMEQRLFAGFSGLLETAHMENPKIHGQLIEIDPGTVEEEMTGKLKENSLCPNDIHIRHEGDKRFVFTWEEVPLAKSQYDDSLPNNSTAAHEPKNIPWKNSGVYLITGGAGGLGQIFANEIVAKVKDVTLILVGRSTLNKDVESKIDSLQANGCKAQYRQLDVSQKDEVDLSIQSILKEFGTIHGILHCAGINRDNYIIKKSKNEIEEVFAAKVMGTVNLDKATKDIPLDFFVLSSSISALGSIGQSDYATANKFMDAYAWFRNELVDSKNRHGHTLSINWSLWKQGGMSINEATGQLMKQGTGMTPMETSTGIQTLYKGLADRMNQIMVMQGDTLQMRQKFLTQPLDKPEPVELPQKIISIDQQVLVTRVRNDLTKTISKLLEVKVGNITGQGEFEKYGFDSITFTEFSNSLNKKFQLDLIPTIFFEYPNLEAFTNYLVDKYQAVFAKYYNLDNKTNSFVENREPATEKTAIPTRSRVRFAQIPTIKDPQTQPSEAIAIIGISGKFPMANNIEELWNNLEQGRDCISEVPLDRWDWRDFYGDPLKEANKTNIKWGGFIDGVGDFDPLFFGISPREAEWMDPQHRLLMTHVWYAIEDGGYSAQALFGKNIGIFVGIDSTGGYSSLIDRADMDMEVHGTTSLIASMAANRISYFMNFHGPSEPIETACSSSLVAIHRGVDAINSGSCDMALVGGVNTILTPADYLGFSKAGALAIDGRCKTFSSQANGFALSEGVGMVFLKKLSEAEAAGDHIYGVILGTAENHGGRASSLTAPNPTAQADLLKNAYTKANIDPRTVTYIETHGTGTKLGDPSEINGLKTAFHDLYLNSGDSLVKNAHCGLGSIKTNIGHSVLAAGVAGVIKVILQLKHKTLVKSLHCEEVNPYIQLQDTPFYLIQENKTWDTLKDGQGNEIPRRAGVSSFGLGGVNAHVVIGEYKPKVQTSIEKTINTQRPSIVLLSARNEKTLKASIQQLVSFLQSGNNSSVQPEISLLDLAYTLQVGRDAMEERFGVVVNSLKELEEKLLGFLNKKDEVDVYFGKVKTDLKDILADFGADDDMSITFAKWIKKGKYNSLLNLWVKGLHIDWNTLLYDGSQQPCRISLPTYPFEMARYWFEEDGDKGRNINSRNKTTAIHPLLHQNSSNLSEQRFSSTFTGHEFFLAEHIVENQKILPGVAHLEMAFTGVLHSTTDHNSTQLDQKDQFGITLKNIVWLRPLTMTNGQKDIHIGLFPNENRHINFEIYEKPDQLTQEGERIVYSQGVAELDSFTNTKNQSQLDIKLLKEQINEINVKGEETYKCQTPSTFLQGPGFRGVEQIFLGNNQALGKLALPPSVINTQKQYVLHPSMMDSAIQVAIYYSTAMEQKAGKTPETEGKYPVPFALQNLHVYRPNTTSMWAWVRYSEGSVSEGNIQKLDIDLCDKNGNICVQMLGFTYRFLGGDLPADQLSTKETVTLVPRWKEAPITQKTLKTPYEHHEVIFCELDQISLDVTEAAMNGVPCRHFQSANLPTNSIANRFCNYGIEIFEKIQKIMENKPQGNNLFQIVFYGYGEQQLFAGLSGMLKTINIENPKIHGQLIEIDPDTDVEKLCKRLKENSFSPKDTHIKYKGDNRLLPSWEKITQNNIEPLKNPWKDGGVYLITGGAGKLGVIFANEIIAKTKNVTIILTGRSILNESTKAEVQALGNAFHNIQYKQLDVTQTNDVKDLINNIQSDFGGLNGIIHCAGIVKDNYVLKKSGEEIKKVFSPKVIGTVNLDLATKDVELDLFILFSSVAAMGSMGQADYAAASSFIDSYSWYRNELVRSKQRHGQTLSINWPLWKDGGMRVDFSIEQMMKQETGMVPMETATGIETLYRGLASGLSQIMVMEGNFPQNVENIFLSNSVSNKTKPKALPLKETSLDKQELTEKIYNDLTQIISDLLKIKIEDIEGDSELTKYGFDSLTFTDFSNRLNQKYQLDLVPTVFFEHPTLDTFAPYLALQYGELFTQHYHIDAKSEINVERKKEPRFTKIRRITTPKSTSSDPIAIIGISGKFPMAKDVDELWNNLEEGKDCISEIPKDRWDWKKNNLKWGGFIDGVGDFDPMFFGISPREAEWMDPQQRLLMTYIWKVIEDGGYSPLSLSGKNIGIFVGTDANSGYGSLIEKTNTPMEAYSTTSQVASLGPNRMSYFLNFHGPSEPIETACSSSLVAIHKAVDSINAGNCDMAIVGGVNTIITPDAHLGYSMAGALAKDGRCKPFSAQANGFVISEGVGMLFLKKLSEAELAKDNIYGVILGTAQNHGGRGSSLTAPNPKAQAELLKVAYTQADINPRSVTYIETHGTGTKLGDPTEINGLKTAFADLYQNTGEPKVSNQHCGLGSIKSNLGHMVLAAGATSVIKVLLQLKHKTLVKSLHCNEINPYIQLKESPFYIVSENKPWLSLKDPQGKDIPRRAGVSSFGIGGVNAHVVIEEYINKTVEQDVSGKADNSFPTIIVLSAKNRVCLDEYAKSLLEFIRTDIAEKEENPYEPELSTLLAERLKSILAQILSIDPKEIMWDLPFTEYGLDKIDQKIFQEKIEESLHIQLDTDDFLMKDTLPEIIEHILEKQQYCETIQDHLGTKSQKIEEENKIFQLKSINLRNLAYTLQIGRDAMEERFGVIVRSLKELKEKLLTFLNGNKPSGQEVYTGHVISDKKDMMEVFGNDNDMTNIINTWINNGKYSKILNLWIKGLKFNWDKLYENSDKPSRISLPTYPFDTKRYWITAEGSTDESEFISKNKAFYIHPLLHQNISNFSEQRFSSTFTGAEFFLADHIVENRKILPGVTYLEMAFAAVNKSAEEQVEEESLGMTLKNVIWLRPIALSEDPKDVYVGLYPKGNGEIPYEIYTNTDDGQQGFMKTAHHQGIAMLQPLAKTNNITPLDIQGLQDKINKVTLRNEEIYKGQERSAFFHGPSLRGIEVIHLGNNEALGKLTIPTTVAETQNQYVMHPSLMDSGIQVALYYAVQSDWKESKGKYPVPFALQTLNVYKACCTSMWVWVRNSNEGNTLSESGVTKLDIDMCNDKGEICVQMRGFTYRFLEGELNTTDSVGVLMAVPCWKEKPIMRRPEKVDYINHQVILCDIPHIPLEEIKTVMNGVNCLSLPNNKTLSNDPIEERFQNYTIQIFKNIKSLMAQTGEMETLIQVLFPGKGENRLLGGIAGLLKTAHLENPKVQTLLIEIAPSTGLDEIVDIIKENSASPEDTHIRYEGKKRLLFTWKEVESEGTKLLNYPTNNNSSQKIPWKEGGVYLITGGAGELGLLFAEEIINKTKNVTLILTGRSILDNEREVRVNALELAGCTIEYRQADLSKREEVQLLIQNVENDFGGLHGIIHCAGFIRDNYILKKTEEEIKDVFAPKVMGTKNLDLATKHKELDFFILFSSMAVMGSFGQADYAAANSFMDAFAQYRNEQVASQKRYGLTLSINWPLWKNGGMRVGVTTEELMKQKTGMVPMEPETGIQALYKGLSLKESQVTVMEGNLNEIRNKVLSPKTNLNKPQASLQKDITVDEEELTEKIGKELTRAISKLLKIDIKDINGQLEFDKYGFDSITFTDFSNRLNKKYDIDLIPTVFFEYSTIDSFALYLAREYKQVFSKYGHIETRGKSSFDTIKDFPKIAPSRVKPYNRFTQIRTVTEPNTQDADPIAIIGMSGKFPMAADLDELWKNLKEGKDCISEIPKDRWDWKAIYGDPLKEANKSNVKWGGFIDGVGEFDPLFFGISPREAILMDVQQRLLMTYIWLAIEDGGYSPKSLSGENIAIFVGTASSGYSQLIKTGRSPIEAFSTTGDVSSLGPNRMSYFLDFHGPSEPIETACSSSLVAIHRGIQSIRSENCNMAVVGGVNTIVSPETHISFNQVGMLCEDGRCKTFSAQANGYVRGEGVGMIFLKKLSLAEKDDDHIYGVIRNSGINHGGRSNSLTAPNPKAQAELLKKVYTDAGIDPRNITYIETHGTGTPLGDPIEINGLKKCFNDLYGQTGDLKASSAHCGLGSIKTNIGHLELAAGIAGVIKLVLQLKNKTLVKSLHCEELNPHIKLKDTPFYIVQKNTPWETIKDNKGRDLPRLGGVSSFGFGGVNAHVVIEEYIPNNSEVRINSNKNYPLTAVVLSAKTKTQLNEYAQKLLNFIQKTILLDVNEQLFLTDLTYTLQLGREAMDERMGVIVASTKELGKKLQQFINGQIDEDGIYTGSANSDNSLISMFTDKTFQDGINKWIEQRKFSKLLELWVKGVSIDWSLLYDDPKPHRISIPSYPFAKEYYWGTEESSGKADANYATRTMCFLKKNWKSSRSENVREFNKTVILLTTKETSKLADLVAPHFTETHILLIEDLSTNFEVTEQQWKTYDGVIDLTGCGSEPNNSSLDWVSLLQLFIEHGDRENSLKLLAVTKGLESFKNQTINLSGALQASLFPMIQNEYSHVQSRHLDIDPLVPEEEELAQQIADEFKIGGYENEVCYREGKRYTSYLSEISTSEETNQIVDFPQDQILLITGGTRGLGYLCANHFVKHHNVKRLVLWGRETLPPRDQWETYDNKNQEIAKKIQDIKSLEAMGAKVQVMSVDLTDNEIVENKVALIKESMGTIFGVIHCAGITNFDNPALVSKPIEEIEKVLWPKVKGLENLYNNLSKESLQFFVLFSSVSATIPSLAVGLSDYAMANGYMDYFASATQESANPVISIQWPNWMETGIGETKSKAYKQTGLLSHNNAEGLSLLDKILSNKMGPVVLPAVVDQSIWNPEKLLQHTIDVSLTIKALDSSTSFNGTENWLTELVAKELKIDVSKLKKNKPFTDYGVDSILLAQLLRKINEALNDDLDTSLLYEYSTIEALSKWLVENKATSLKNIEKLSVHAEDREKVTQDSPPKKSTKIINPIKTNEKSSDIAVIGMSCRFAGANSLEEYWQLLTEGRCEITQVPETRWGYKSNFHAGMLNPIGHFDPNFFLIPIEDARGMDPQAFLLLEETLKTIYHAGYTNEEIKGEPIGVYMGARSLHQPSELQLKETINPIITLGQNYLASNISQYFDLRGPSLVIDTACSSALVGMHMAIQALEQGEINAALVGGVNLLNTDGAHQIFKQRDILGTNETFHIFDQRANGVVLGEGVGVVLLKRLDLAIRDNDSIYGVIKGIAVNNDGRTAGPATPSLNAQKEVLQKALNKSSKEPEEITYIEANGSGSEVTDLLEIKAIEFIYRQGNTKPCAIGSVKPNIGHSLCAEGIAAFIKVVLMVNDGKIVPFLSGKDPMKHYDFHSSPFYFCRESKEWNNTTTKTGAINCFADGGTNAHVIVEEWEELEESKVLRKPISCPKLNSIYMGDNKKGQVVEVKRGVTVRLNRWKRYGVGGGGSGG